MSFPYEVLKAEYLNSWFQSMRQLIQHCTKTNIYLSHTFIDGEKFEMKHIKNNLEDLLSAFEKQENELTASSIDALVREVESAIDLLKHLASEDGWDGPGRQIKARDWLRERGLIAREALEDK